MTPRSRRLAGTALLVCVTAGAGTAAFGAAPATMAELRGAPRLSDDPPVVRETIAFVVVEPAPPGLRVSVVQRLTGAADRTAGMTDEIRLVFPLPRVSPLPRRSEPVEFVSGWRHPAVAQDAIIDAIPKLRGTIEVAYAFGFEPRSGTATLRWVFPYGAADVELLVPLGLMHVSSAAMRAAGSVTERGRSYARWSGGPVLPGETVTMRLDGLPAPDGRSSEIAAAVLAGVLACALVVALRRRQSPTPDPSRADATPAP